VFDFGEQNGELFMVMELITGSSLASEIPPLSGPPISLLRVADLFDQILCVLEEVHNAGVVHRDLKPENTMLTGPRRDLVKILDFGLALVQTGNETQKRLTETGSVHGTPHYMSPEQCRGADVGPPTDIYAVGCMLFEVLAGVPPFDASDTAGLMAQQMFIEPPPIADVGLRVSVSIGLEKVVRRALAKAASERPTAAEFRNALQTAFAGADPDALMARAASERVIAAGLSREDRALTGVARKSSDPGDGDPNAETVQRVGLWADQSPATKGVRDFLAVNGYRVSVIVNDGELPSLTISDEPVRVLVLTSWAEGKLRLERLRSSGDKRPVLVVGVQDAADMAQWIRLGADDVVLMSAPKDELAKKVKRVLKRKR
jgi:eukaryotic-like serine/threonine-protein kinase